MPMDLSNSSLLIESWDMSTSQHIPFRRQKQIGSKMSRTTTFGWFECKMFESCEMWGVVNGSKTLPPDNKDHAIQHCILKKKDSLAKAIVIQSIKADLIIKVTHPKHAKES